MTGLIRGQLVGLSRTIADLKERVRAAVAGELGRAVSGAVREVVRAAVSGRADPPRPEPPPADGRPHEGWEEEEDDRWDRARDPWDDDRDEDDGPDRTPSRRDGVPPAGSPGGIPGVAAAVAAGVYAARWWLARTGTRLAAAGVGLGVGLLGVVGGPLARTAVAVLAAVGDLLGAADAGGGSARPDRP